MNCTYQLVFNLIEGVVNKWADNTFRSGSTTLWIVSDLKSLLRPEVPCSIMFYSPYSSYWAQHLSFFVYWFLPRTSDLTVRPFLPDFKKLKRFRLRQKFWVIWLFEEFCDVACCWRYFSVENIEQHSVSVNFFKLILARTNIREPQLVKTEIISIWYHCSDITKKSTFRRRRTGKKGTLVSP